MGKHQSYHIVINENAGTVINETRAVIEKKIQDSGIEAATVKFLKPDEITQFLEKLEKQGDDAPILIGGGDGTVTSVASSIQNKKLGFGILPLGTMNLMASDLGVPNDFSEALSAYAKGFFKSDIDFGMVNEHLFLCSAGIGTIPESSEFREANRSQSDPFLYPRMTLFVLDQLDVSNHRKFKLMLGNRSKTIRSAALVFSNNEYQESRELKDSSLRRKSLKNGLLGIYSAAPASFWDKIRLLTRLSIGGWQKDPVLRRWISREAVLHTPEQEELVSIDGEPVLLKTPLYIKIMREQLTLLVPAQDKGR
jgi:diacylglycerol kinase family enzyme